MRHRFDFLFTCLPLLFVCGNLPAQLVQFKGKLLEYAENQWSPLEGVPVKVLNYGSKLTDSKGAFSLDVRPDAKLLRIEIDLSNHKMAAPFEGIFGMPLPPGDQAEIIVLRETQDKPLCDEVDELHTQLRNLKKHNRLETNRLNAINRAMFDTIRALRQRESLAWQTIENLNRRLDLATSQQDSLRHIIANLTQENERLKRENDKLIEEVYQLKQEKYLRQQALYEEISAALQDYLDRLRDLQKALVVFVPAYFDPMNPQAAPYYTDALNAYNAAWKVLSLHHQGFITGVKGDWEDENVGDELEATCRFLLEDIHQRHVLPMDEEPGVHFFLRNRKSAKAKQSAEKLHDELEPLAQALELKIQNLNQKLRSNI